MSLVITCSKCKQRYILSLEESDTFRKVIKTKEQLDSILCPKCENKQLTTTEEETHGNRTENL
jgi:Zn finger protein HypA/HybF involved in hydrogenase expression